ncbi:AefR-like transcriptional repressor, C-terminal region [Sphingopyxis indica]|uniref:AefR-like transcriptional repressor, C-terminal region n=1 Tax=Sphingopyxis indica TaxID=436663 RepID=A0A239IL78_9SPHN|nr:AefR-like transcriptional repressor, C-terminal region [Sphingopyxis indica]
MKETGRTESKAAAARASVPRHGRQDVIQGVAPDLAHSIDENGSLVTVPPADWIVCFVPGLKKQWWHRFCNRDHKHVFALRPMETGSWVLVEPWWTRLMVTVLPSSDAVRFLRWGAAGDMVRLREAVPGRGNQLKGWFNCAVMVGFLLGRSSWVWTPHALYKQLVSETGAEHEDVESLLVEHFRKVLDRNMRRALSLDARIARRSTAEILTELARNILSLIMSREIIDLHHTAIIEAERFPGVAQCYQDHAERPAVSAIADVLRSAAEAGEFAMEDPDAFAHSLMGLMRGTLHLDLMIGIAAQPTPEDIDYRARAAVDVILKSL